MKNENTNIADLAGASELRLIKLSTCAARENVSMATVHNYRRKDPTFPRVFHDSNGIARVLESEHNAYLAKKYSLEPGKRLGRMDKGKDRLAKYRAERSKRSKEARAA